MATIIKTTKSALRKRILPKAFVNIDPVRLLFTWIFDVNLILILNSFWRLVLQAGAASCAGSSRRISLITPNPTLPASAAGGGGVALSTAADGGDDDSASTLAPEDEVEVLCKICLVEYGTNEMVAIGDCGCAFCKEVTQTF